MYPLDKKLIIKWLFVLIVSFVVAYSFDRYYFFKEGSCFANNSISSVNEVLRKIAGK